MGSLTEARERLATVENEAWAVLDPAVLQLCRARIATLLGAGAEVAERRPGAEAARGLVAELPSWPTSPRFTPAQRACLAFAEQFTLDVTGLTDAHAAAVLEHLTPAELYGLVQALLVFDETLRLQLALAALGMEDAA